LKFHSLLPAGSNIQNKEYFMQNKERNRVSATAKTAAVRLYRKAASVFAAFLVFSAGAAYAQTPQSDPESDFQAIQVNGGTGAGAGRVWSLVNVKNPDIIRY
jgi:hypothetical protein